jgi:hypothetical protein
MRLPLALAPRSRSKEAACSRRRTRRPGRGGEVTAHPPTRRRPPRPRPPSSTAVAPAGHVPRDSHGPRHESATIPRHHPAPAGTSGSRPRGAVRRRAAERKRPRGYHPDSVGVKRHRFYCSPCGAADLATRINLTKNAQCNIGRNGRCCRAGVGPPEGGTSPLARRPTKDGGTGARHHRRGPGVPLRVFPDGTESRCLRCCVCTLRKVTNATTAGR